MIPTYESNHLVKLYYAMQTPDEKSAEGIEFFQVVEDYLSISNSYIMMWAEQVNIIIKIKLGLIPMRSAIFLIYFFNDLFCYHCFMAPLFLPQ